VWAQRPEAARALAEAHGSRVVGSLEELWDVCEAVAFAVPPDVQAELAAVAARAGRHLLLDKPVALTVAAAEELAAVVGEAGVVSQMVLTNRYAPTGRAFLAAAEEFEMVGARCASLSGRGDPLRWVSLTLPLVPTVFECTLYGPTAALTFWRPPDPPSVMADLQAAGANLRREFAAAVTSGNASAPGPQPGAAAAAADRRRRPLARLNALRGPVDVAER
jgi:Oxidoreductase family, NAD-binding Rossmann fold